MNLKIITLLILLLLSFVYAQEFYSYNLEISLKPSGLAHQKIQNIFTLNQDTGSILFSTDQEIQNIKIYNDQDLDFSLTDQGILINKSIKVNEINNIFIEFDTKDLVKQSGKDFIFSLDFSLPFESKQTKIKVSLPEGFILSGVDSPTSPKPTKIETDGKLISIIWDTKTQEESFIVIYKRGHSDKSDPLIPLYITFSSLIIILIAIIIFLINKRKTKEFISETLSENENQIVKIIRENKNITQKKISQITSFSKSKMSKLIRRLEEKGIVKKKPFFKTNKFDLSKRLK